MRLFISETFFEAVIELPKRIQDKVVAFQRKFRENQKTLGIHLEPIAQFKNSTLRTARVDDNYRAVVGVLNGDNYTLLFVGNHEAAYDWGKNKRFQWNEHTQSCQLISVREDSEVRQAEPVEAAPVSIFSAFPDEKLLKIGVPEDILAKVKAIADFDCLDAIEKLLPEDAYENIFNILDGEDIDVIISEIEEGQAKADEDKLLSNNNKRRYVELTDDDTLRRMIEQDMDKWQIFLHPSQRRLVHSDYKGTVKVSGGAGTGKTVAALHRLKYLSSAPRAKVLFTTYTKTLRDNLEESIRKMEVPREKYTLNNIDQVLLELARQYKIKDGYKVLDYSGDDESLRMWREVLETEVTEYDEQFLYDEYIDVVVYFGNKTAKEYMMQPRVGRTRSLSRKQRIDVWRLIERYLALKDSRKVLDRQELFNELTNYLNDNNIHPYTNVIADEFQDFSNPELKFLRALVAEGKNDLFLTGDPMQRIYTGRKINFSAAGINVRGVRSRRLKVNYRTTEPIKKAGVSVINGLTYDDMDGGVESIKGYVSLIHGGEKPSYVVVKNAAEEVAQVVEWINECSQSGISLKEICVAAPSVALIKDLQTKMHTSGMKYQVLKGATRQGIADGVSLCTFHSMKGLEFRVIILLGVNERNLPSKVNSSYCMAKMDALAQKEYLSSIRSLLYVAITRARQLVFMVGYGEPCGLLDNMK